MPFRIACLLLVLLGLSTSAFAQEPTKAEASVGYTYLRANEASGLCGCFGLNGVSGSFALNMSNSRFSGVVDVGYQRKGNLNGSGIDLNLLTYMAGPRFSLRGHKLTFFAQALAGGATAHSSSAFNNGTNFAGSVGGGANFRITSRFLWRVIEADYLLTRIPNGDSNTQNNIRITTGIVVRLGRPVEGPRRPYNPSF
jgi:outer membrane immunogenic protein